MDYRSTQEVMENLMRHLGCGSWIEVCNRLHIDEVKRAAPTYIGPALPPDEDAFGIRYKIVNYGSGTYKECVYHPLAQYQTVEEIERNYKWPSPDRYDYFNVAKRARGWEEYPITGGQSEPFLTYCYLRGQVQAYMDMVLNPEMVHYCLGKLYGLALEDARRIYEQIPGQVTITMVAEDMGSQESLLFSREHIKEFFFPHMKKMIDQAHAAGAFVITHSDGAVRPIIPDLIELGVNILDPVQWRCRGMEREELKRDFGNKLVFHGGVDNQQTLAFGQPEDVRAEVIENIRTLGAGGGYILGPCHNIQPVTSPENIVTMYETGYEFGWT
jgi:uroporphyrinogen decarboxylase